MTDSSAMRWRQAVSLVFEWLDDLEAMVDQVDGPALATGVRAAVSELRAMLMVQVAEAEQETADGEPGPGLRGRDDP